MRATRVFAEAVVALILALVIIAPVQSQDVRQTAESAPAAEPIRVDEEVIVRGQRLSDIEFDLRIYIKDFIEQVAAPARTRGYARWQRSVCIGVHNLQHTPAQYIVDRISSLAKDEGLEAGEPGCKPQVNIIFVTDAKATASLMVERSPRVFRPAMGNAGMDLGLEGLDEFTQSDKPVRWWHVAMPVDARTGAPAIRFPGQPAPTIAVQGPSRLHSGIKDNLLYVIIIVDSTKLIGTTWQQLADYLAVISLAQIDPRSNPLEFDSILNLFSNPAAYSGLTDWDRSYLHALYSFDQERDSRLQRNNMVSIIARRELEGSD
jgi:hypothetical protein